MIVGDLPIEAAEIAVVLELAVGGKRRGFDAVDRAQNVRHFVEVRFSDRGDLVRIASARGAVVLRLAGFLVLVSAEEEDAIWDNRSTQIGSPALVGLDRRDRATGDGVTAHAAVRIF